MNKVNNPSVSYADSSLYTREPLMLASRLYSLYRMISSKMKLMNNEVAALMNIE